MSKRKIALFLVCIMLLTAFAAGCAKNNAAVSNSDDEQVTLKWVIGGLGQQKDSELVWEEFNKKLAEYLPNTKVEFDVIPFSDFAEKWRLMAASQEKVDIVWVGWMLDLNEEAQKGSLLPLDDLLASVPDLTRELPEYLFRLGSVNGKVYCIPNYQIQTNLPWGTKTKADLAEKYLDTDKITEIFDKQEAPTKDDYKIFGEYLERLKQNGELQKGVARSFLNYILGRIGRGSYLETVIANAAIDIRDPELKVYDLLTDFPENKNYFAIANEWYNKGYIRKDILSVQDYAADENKKDGYVLWSHSSFKDDSATQTAKYGFPIVSVPTFQNLYIPSTRPSSNTGIARVSEHPERAIKLLELMNTSKGKELYNLLTFGIEGRHYKKTDKENVIEWLGKSAPGASSDDAYGFNNWAVGNIFNGYETQFDIPGWNEYILHDVNEKATPSPLIGFMVDTTPIKLEIAQYNAIMQEYDYVNLGANDNWKELIEERNEKLKKAGSDKIVEEVRRQIEEWKKTK